jgi:signal peptide peptidase SppA
MQYEHILSFVNSTPWALLQEKLAIILDLLAFRAAGYQLSEEEIRMRIGAAAPRLAQQNGAIAVLPLYGTIIPRGNMMMESSGATSVERFTAAFRAALNAPDISGIVIDIDSPGGAVTGVDELASEIYNARGQKPINAIASPMAASAAYWIGTAADSLSVTPTGEVGSIGVFAAHRDMSAMMEKEGIKTTLISAGKYKVEGNPYEPLTDEARETMQGRVDDYYGMFVDAVGRNRGVKASAVRGGMGEGRLVGARSAIELNMADRIETMDEMMRRLTGDVRQISHGKRAEGQGVNQSDLDRRYRRVTI